MSDYKWYEVGPDNPFPFRVLDVRSLTWNVVSSTTDPKIAESYLAQRQTDGREYIDARILNASTVECRLAFPHNGDRVEGIAFKADAMEVKWDIYVYDSVCLFVRSWTGELQYRVYAEIGATDIVFRKIEAPTDLLETAPQAVYFILGTHAMGRVLPHTISRKVPKDAQQIAVLSFSLYGNLACYATYGDITQMEIPRLKAEQ